MLPPWKLNCICTVNQKSLAAAGALITSYHFSFSWQSNYEHDVGHLFCADHVYPIRKEKTGRKKKKIITNVACKQAAFHIQD